MTLIRIGPCTDDNWLELVRPNLVDRMAAYEEDEIEFSILGLVHDPLPDLITELAVSVKGLGVLHERAPTLGSSADALACESVLGPDPSLSLTRELIEAAVIPAEILEAYRTCPDSELLGHQQTAHRMQCELRNRIREEQQSHRSDDEYAAGRRHDYGPAVRWWLRLLARKQELQALSLVVE